MRSVLFLRLKHLVIVPVLVDILGNKNPTTENQVGFYPLEFAHLG